MKIIRPYAKMMPLPGTGPYGEFDSRMGILLLRHIEWCARISHRSEDATTEESWKRIVESVVMKHGDWSVVEHATVSVDMVVDRGITHEWVRHRLNAFTQESTRFVNYEKKMPPSFIYPVVGIECEYCLEGIEVEATYRGGGDYSFTHGLHPNDPRSLTTKDVWGHPDMPSPYKKCAYDSAWLNSIFYAEKGYKDLLAQKWRPQEARSVFPNALASRIITTSNLRNWRHMFIMRCSAQAHPQMRQVMIPLLKEFQEKIPLLFDDIVPEQQQSEAMKRAR